ncbi:MAG: RHS repeat-associated core domain-containing protein [Anaerolineales bacterium]|nr:RHS repeat-associated core domain-containing protein [Anaerolineales bacterium]HPO87652.1 RHS repeat-associated core domain-containing protein [Candidatus Hydrogenedentota bacterium]
MKKYIVPQTTTLTYLVGDHLGSTSLAVDTSTGDVVQTRYKPWGEVRFTTANTTLPTRYTFTGQYSYVSDDATDLGNAGFGLMFYNARWYDPTLGRFAQADTIIPTSQGAQAWDRYAYVNNNPVRYNDPTGHRVDDGCRTEGCATDMEKINWRLRIILGKSNPGDVLQAKLKNGENNEFVFTHDPNGALILWNVNEGRAWEGISALQYLSQNVTNAGLFQMSSDGSYSLLRDKHNFIGNLDSSSLPYPIEAGIIAQNGTQLGLPSPGSNLPYGYDNGNLHFKKNTGDPYGLFWLGVSIVVQETKSFGPLTPIISVGLAYKAVEDLYQQWHTWTITDVVYNPGINQPYYAPLP